MFLGKFLHIHHFVFLIDNLKTEHGFNHVFHRDDATHGAVLVDNHGDVLFLLKEFLPNVGNTLIFSEGKNRTRKVLEFDIKLVLRQFLKNLLLQHIARDIVVVLLFIEGNAGELGEVVAIVEFSNGL